MDSEQIRPDLGRVPHDSLFVHQEALDHHLGSGGGPGPRPGEVSLAQAAAISLDPTAAGSQTT